MVYAHCIEPKNLNHMEDWFTRTDLHNILKIKEVSEEKLYNALDSINDKNLAVIQRKIFRSVTEEYNLHPKGYFFDVTNVYFYGTECSIAKKGHNKEGSHNPQVQIGLAVTKEEGIPIFHKTFEGNIFDSRILQDFLVEFNDLNIEDITLVWDRGVTSEMNIIDAKRAGFEVICGLANKGNLPDEVDVALTKSNLISPKNRVQLKESSFYVSVKNIKFEDVAGYLYICLNPKQQVEQREKRLKNIFEAKILLQKKKQIDESIKKYFNANGGVLESKIEEDAKYDGVSIIFSTKNVAVQELIRKYFDKDTVEKAFACLKGVIKVRPVRNWIAGRVKAHIFICYLSYLLLSILDYKLKMKNVKVTSIEALDQLETMYKIYLNDSKNGNEFVKTVLLTKMQENILKAINKNLIKPSN